MNKLRLVKEIPYGVILQPAARPSDGPKRRRPAVYIGRIRSVGGKTAEAERLHLLLPGISEISELLEIAPADYPRRMTAVTEHTIVYDYDSRAYTGEDTQTPRATWTDEATSVSKGVL
jgi:hypothetical protein